MSPQTVLPKQPARRILIEGYVNPDLRTDGSFCSFSGQCSHGCCGFESICVDPQENNACDTRILAEKIIMGCVLSLLFVAFIGCILVHKLRKVRAARRLETIKVTQLRELKLTVVPKEFRDNQLCVNTKIPKKKVSSNKVVPIREREVINDLPVIVEIEEVESPCKVNAEDLIDQELRRIEQLHETQSSTRKLLQLTPYKSDDTTSMTIDFSTRETSSNVSSTTLGVDTADSSFGNALNSKKRMGLK